MGALAPDIKWTPADDLMLKNAIEAGASLESLSGGAVRFSQRYTIQELQDRWHSILYDPIVSEEAADLMFKYECSLKTHEKSNNMDGKDNNSLSGKRKAESIRTLYYAMRKRISNVSQDGDGPLEMNFLASGPGLTNYGDRNDHHFADYIEPDSCHQSCPDSTFEQTTQSCPDLFGGALPASANHMTSATSIFVGRDLSLDPGDLGQNAVLPPEGTLTPVLPVVDCDGKEDNINDTFRSSHDVDNLHVLPSSVLHPNANLTEQMPSLGPETETAGLIAQLNQFMDCTDPEDLPEFDMDSLSTLLVDYPDEHEEATEGCPGLTLSMNPDFPEPRNGVNCCKLNTEDNAIPDNDDVFLPVCMPTESLSCLADGEFDKAHNPVSASIMDIPTHQISSRGGLLMMKREQSDKDNNHLSSHRTSSSFVTHQKVRNEGALMMKREQIGNEMSLILNSSVPALQNSNQREMVPMLREETENNQPHISSHIMGSLLQPVMDSNHAVNVNFHDENHNLKHTDSQSDMPRNEIANKQINQLKCTNVNKNNSGGVYIKEKGIYGNDAEDQNDHPVGASLEGEVIGHNHIRGSTSVVDASKPKSEISSELHNEVLSQEELDTSRVIANESEKDPELLGNEEWLDDDDDDVPCFSDVEAMILDMDFSPDDEDNDLSETVSQDLDEKLIRTMLRLEQAARASSHRMMQAYGAFAVLYSHHSRHLIKKPEVVLGRAAVDYEVDIDLSKERCRNKVSRRQAIIKVSGGGTFYLKNLGKVSIYVNGREVAPGQSQALTSSCLIEIRKAAFLFETNPARVKQYIEEENLRSKTEQDESRTNSP